MTFHRKRTTAALATAVTLALAGSVAAQGDSIFTDDYENPGAGGACVPDGDYYTPLGYALGHSPTLEQLWVETTGTGIGGSSATVRLEGGQYAAFRFTRQMFPADETVGFNGDTSNVGVGLAGADHRYVAISECAGDLRLADAGSPDPTRQTTCRVFPLEGPFLYVNWGAPRAGFCNLDPAKTYYFNVIFDNPSDGYNASQLCNTVLMRNACGYRMAVAPL